MASPLLLQFLFHLQLIHIKHKPLHRSLHLFALLIAECCVLLSFALQNIVTFPVAGKEKALFFDKILHEMMGYKFYFRNLFLKIVLIKLHRIQLCMNTYRITFINNDILNITLSDVKYKFEGDVYYYEKNSLLIFAYVKADDTIHARDIAMDLIEK